MLIDNGADISYGDMARYACTAAQQNSIELLKDIIKYGGDVTLPSSDGTTMLHLAVCEGNVEMVKFLLEQGADINKENIHGISPKDYAEQQGHEDVKSLFEVSKYGVDENQTGDQKKNDESKRFAEKRSLGRFRSEPTIIRESRESTPCPSEGLTKKGHGKMALSKFQNSLFGVMSPAHSDNNNMPLLSSSSAHLRDGFGYYTIHKNCAHHHNANQQHGHNHYTPLRVHITCPEKDDIPGKLVLLPRTIEGLLTIGTKKFGFQAVKVLTKDWAEVDDVQLIQDGEHLLLVSHVWRGYNNIS